MKIEGLQLFEIVDVADGTRLDFLLGLPEVVVLRQILGIDSHLNNFTVLLQLAENVNIDVAPVVDVSEVLVLGFHLPISQQNSVLEDVLGRDLVVSFHDGPPVGFRQSVMGEVNDTGGKLVCSSVLFFGFLLLSHGQVFHASISRCLQPVQLLLLAHDVLMTITRPFLTEDHL